MSLRTSARDDHIVGNQRLAIQINGGGVNCLVFFKRFENQFQRLLVFGLFRLVGTRYFRASIRRFFKSSI